MKQIGCFLALIFFLHTGFAQNKILINSGSKNYTAELSVNCKEGECSGPGTVKLFDKKTGKHFQTLSSDDLFIFPYSSAEPSVNVITLYGEQSALIFDDFNFDGYEDLAIRNGNNSGYRGPSYDVYVYNITRKKFVLSHELTELAHDNLGMFQTDHKEKRLTTFSKSGCCWHLTTQYEVIPRKGLLKVYEFEEDAASPDGNSVIVTTRTLVKGKWLIETETIPMAEYYPEEATEKSQTQ